MLDVTMEHLCIPFHTAFRHASATRSETQSLWVEARSSDGTVGYGEGCPREYVTGESLRSSVEFFQKYRISIASEIHDLASLKDWSETHRVQINHYPAAWCAVELALLDLFAKEASQTIEQYLGLPKLDGSFRYTAVLGDSDLPTFQRQLARYQAIQFSDYKIKISGDFPRDQAKFDAVLATGVPPNRIRLDANNVWKSAKDAVEYLQPIAKFFHAIEEPIGAEHYPGMLQIAQSLKVKIVLDESFCRIDQFDRLEAVLGPWVLNLRISKLGGILRSLAIVDRARALGIPVIVGAQVGETSLLTRAALTIAAAAQPVLVGQEGAFGTLLIATDVCDPGVIFGKEGKLSWAPSTARSAGFGLKVTRPTPYLQALS